MNGFYSELMDNDNANVPILCFFKHKIYARREREKALELCRWEPNLKKSERINQIYA